MLRMLIAIVVGIALAVGSVALFDAISHALYPLPPGLDLKDPAVQAVFVESLPDAAKAIIVSGWFFAPLYGALAAIAIAKDSFPGWIVAAFFLAASTMNLILIPHPQWMVIACFTLPGIAAMLAQLMLSRRIEG